MLGLGGGLISGGTVASAASSSLPPPVTISDGWQLQDAAKVPEAGAVVAAMRYKPRSWYTATVPGTVLTSLVNNGVYPEPLYGENNRPDKIPDSLSRTPYWYRTVFKIPKALCGKACVAELRRDQLLCAGMGKRKAGWCDEGRLWPGSL